MYLEKVIPQDARDEFWAVVRDCLREFHGMTPETSRRKAAKLRSMIEGMEPESVALFDHCEPFGVACDIAGKELDVTPHAKRYLYLRDEKHAAKIQRRNQHRARS